MRIVVAMSGGVDSSTAAGLLVEQGHEVVGLAMKTHDLPPRANRACCTPDDMRDARAVADHLGIPFFVLNYTELFKTAVIEPFAAAYQRGHTPNPCIECNDKVKFRTLLERARMLDAERLATGHYARISERDGVPRLRRGADRTKDQSYFLYRLNAAQLAQTMFPVGDMPKAEVRAHAERLGLPVAHKAESQEICFVGEQGYAQVVESIAGAGRAGHIVDGEGKQLGQHAGVHHFTLGQRRGLRIAAPEPLYVTGIDPASGEVRVGGRDQLLVRQARLGNVTWGHTPPPDGTSVDVQQRYREAPRRAIVEHAGEHVLLNFVEPTLGGAPGQAAVLYTGDEVLGGGVLLPQPLRREANPEPPAGFLGVGANPDVP